MPQNSSILPGCPYVKDPQNFVRDFLFSGANIYQDDTCIRSRIFMDLHTEGWIGIPHGGIGMGAVMELTMMLRNYPNERDSPYPLSADFRMGGASVWIGDTVNIEISPADGGASGVITIGQDVLPYISAAIGYRNEDPHRRDLFKAYISNSFSYGERKLIPLPYYKNCFVCGVERVHPGLNRSFYLLDNNPSGKIVIATAGFDAGDRKTFYLFRRNDIIHPLAFLALVDETMGWAGFMASASGAVTVRIGYTFYRNIHVGERLIFFGRCEKMKGNVGSRLLFWASGGVAAMDNEGRLEVVIAASGQYLGVAELTEQMKVDLIPKEFTSRAFSLAGA